MISNYFIYTDICLSVEGRTNSGKHMSAGSEGVENEMSKMSKDGNGSEPR